MGEGAGDHSELFVQTTESTSEKFMLRERFINGKVQYCTDCFM